MASAMRGYVAGFPVYQYLGGIAGFACKMRFVQICQRNSVFFRPIYLPYRTLQYSSVHRKTVPENYDVNKSKFSESLAFKSRQREFIEKRSRKLGAAGGAPDLGDYYDTFDFKRKERFSVFASLVAFMAYFLVFREENDIDASLYRPLWMSVPSLEKEVIQHKMVQAEVKGEDTSELETRLEELVHKEKNMEEQLKNKKTTYEPPWKKISNKS